MSKKKHPSSQAPRTNRGFPWWILAPVILIAAVAVAVKLRKPASTITTTPSVSSNAINTASATNAPPPLEVNQAVMVTVELDFGGGKTPSIAEALTQVERRYQPTDGQGRTFAILDAYGNSTGDNKLHISMHVSTEKPGKGSLVFKRTGEVLWESTIRPGTNGSEFTGKNLLVLVDNGEGQNKSWTMDGSSSPTSILDAIVREKNRPLRDLWPDGTNREFTYLYSACGCPVKAMVRREGDHTVRTSDQPVLFPDDPAALQVISRLMGW